MDNIIGRLQEEYERYLLNSHKTLILFMVNDSTGLKYGVGTYLDSIIRLLEDEREIDFIEVVLKAFIPSRDPLFEYHGDIPRYLFPSNNALDDDYYRSVCFYLMSRINRDRKIILHCNYACQLPLAMHFKEYLMAKIVYTQHYMDWCIRFGPDYTHAAPQLAQDGSAMGKFDREKEIMGLADTVIVSTRRAAQTLESIYGIDQSKIKMIPLAIVNKPEIRQKECLRTKYNLSDERILLYVGRLDENKCVGDIIEAVSKLEDENVRLWIVGDGNYSEYMTLIDERNWHRIVFWGFRDRNTLSDLYSIAEFGVVPSIYEEFGYVALEMIVHGLPVIARRTSGLIEILENCVQGELFDFNSSTHDIMKVIHYRLDHPFSERQRHELTDYATSRYAFQHFKHATKEVYESLNREDMESGLFAIAHQNLLLKSIADKEIMNLLFVRDGSLLDGMTGLAIFFAFLSRAENNKAYEDVAEYILNRVCDEIPEDISLGFRYGLTGIGWGIIFLKDQGFIDSDIECILTDLDDLVYRRLLMRKVVGLNDDELCGMCRYVQARLDQAPMGCHLSDGSILTKLKLEMDKRDFVSQPGIWEVKNIWKVCLEYWRQRSSEEEISWKSGLLIMEEQFCSRSSLINITSELYVHTNIKLKDDCINQL